MDDLNISWPAIRFTKPSSIMLVCKNKSDLCKVTYIGIAEINKDNERFLISSDLKKYALRNAKMIDNPGIIRKIFQYLSNPIVEISYNISYEGDISLSELKELIKDNFHSFKDFWWDYEDPDIICNEIDNFDDIIELMDFMKKF